MSAVSEFPNGTIKYGVSISGPEIVDENGYFVSNSGTIWDGEKGDKGDKGDSGYTPQRGIDYWTPSDIAEIKTYVDEAILGGAW